MKPLSSNRSHDDSDNVTPETNPGRSRANRLIWLCAAVGSAAAVAILLLFGFSTWTALAFVFLVACPAIVAWVLIVEYRRDSPLPGSKR